MKVCIFTFYRVANYGTVLQAFAIQELLKNLGFKTEIVNYITEAKTFKKVFFKYPPNYKDKNFKKILYILSRFPANILKYMSFRKFINKNLHLSSDKYISHADLEKYPPRGDIYLTGSDQVWNSYYNEKIDKGFYLDFGSKNIKRISFASSFGKDKLDYYEYEETKKLLTCFDHISVREKQGVHIINEMGLKSTLVLDPTLMFDYSEWNNYLNPKKIKMKYVLLFTLYNEDNGATEYARKIADAKGLIVIQLYWKPIKRQGVDRIAIYKTPFEFLRYIRDAEYIVTNSFHGTAFAINFNKQFITVTRSEFNSRLENILDLCDLEERYITTNFNISQVLTEIDYSKVNKIIENEREKSMQYLKKSLFE